MGISVQCDAKISTENQLTAGDIKRVLENVPDEALIQHIVRMLGSQRDPVEVLVGLRATWYEQR